MQTQSDIATYEPSAKSAAGSRRRVERWFYIGVGLFLILLSIVGFGPSIIDQSRRNGPSLLLAMAHGLVAGGWFLLFLTQATLAATKTNSPSSPPGAGRSGRLGHYGEARLESCSCLAYRSIAAGFLMSLQSGRPRRDSRNPNSALPLTTSTAASELAPYHIVKSAVRIAIMTLMPNEVTPNTKTPKR